MSASRAFVGVVVVSIATGAFVLAAAVDAASAHASPYPPVEPCAVTATARGAASDGTGSYDVAGSGLGAAQPVRVVLAATGKTIGVTRTDSDGTFRTVVNAPSDGSESAPNLTATSPQRSCSWVPPSASSTVPTTAPPPAVPSAGPTARPTTQPATQPATQRPTSAAGPLPAPPSGSPGGGTATTGGSSTTATASATSGPTSSGQPPTGTATGAVTPTSVPRAEPLPRTDTPFGIGLGIAAVLLVLGTLAVLLLTRRPEH